MKNVLQPNRYLLVGGTGTGPSKLNAFDRALQDAGTGNFNLVRVTSILPPGASEGSLEELRPGSIVFSAMGSITSNTPGEIISAAVAVGIPGDERLAGVLMEGGFKLPREEAEKRVREMVRIAMDDRRIENYQIKSLAVDIQVRDLGAAMASVLLWRSYTTVHSNGL